MPVANTMPGVQVVTNKAADLTAKKAGDLATAKIDLYTNNVTPTPDSVVGDFTIATFTGYAQKSVVAWGANEEPGDGSVSTDATTVLEWVGPGDATGQTIYGYMVRSAAMGNPLIEVVPFAAPVGLNVPTDVLDVVPTFRIP